MTRSPRAVRALAAMVVCLLVGLSACSSSAPPAAGKRVQGSSEATTAPTLHHGDSWDQLGAAGTDAGVRVYAIAREEAEEGIWVTATVQPQAHSDDRIKVELTTPTGEQCAGGVQSASPTLPSPLLGVTVTSHIGKVEPCLGSDRLMLTVRRGGQGAQQPVSLRLRLVRVPPANPETFPEPATLDDSPQAPQMGAGIDGKPGSWLSDAETIDGRTLRGEVAPRTLHTYRLPVRWGQGVRVQTVFPTASPSRAEQVKEAGIRGSVVLLDPAGGIVEQQIAYLGADASLTLKTDPIGYHDSGRGVDLEGMYTVVVTATSTKETDTMIPYLFTAHTIGNANAALGPKVAMESGSGAPEPLLWTLLMLGVLLIIAGMTQVTMHRQHHS